MQINIFCHGHWPAQVITYREALIEEQYLDANWNLPISSQVSTIKSTKCPLWKQS